MQRRRSRSGLVSAAPGIMAMSFVATAAGCRFAELRDDVRGLDGLGTVHVRVAAGNASETPGPIHVVVLETDADAGTSYPHVVRQRLTMPGPGEIDFTSAPGRFQLIAWLDADRNERLDTGEWVARTRTPVRVTRGSATRTVRLTLRERADREKILGDRQIIDSRRLRSGEVTTLDDPRFSPERATEGVWRPLRSLDETPAGLFFLSPFEPGKMPVVFIHGMGGHPREFRALVDGLDRERFQPWVFRYPSGFRLGLVARALQRTMAEVRALHDIDGVCLVAHSMGGLVARKTLGLDAASPTPVPYRALVTIASPLGGLSSAATGVAMAPTVVPSWRDLAHDSEYIAELYETPLRGDVRYTLLFAYQGDGANDGVVPLRSQLRQEAQDEAVLVRGFETSHAGALSDERVAARVSEALDDCYAQSTSPLPTDGPDEDAVATAVPPPPTVVTDTN